MNTLEYIRSYKISDYSAFDLVLAFVGVWLVAPLLSRAMLKLGVRVPKISWVIWTLPIAILAYIIVGNITPITAQFLNPSGYYILKIVIVVLTVYGFRGIKRINIKKK